MRKTVLLIVALLAIVGALTACSHGGNEGDTANVNPLMGNDGGTTERASTSVPEASEKTTEPETEKGEISSTEGPSAEETYSGVPGKKREDTQPTVQTDAPTVTTAKAGEPQNRISYTAAMDRLGVKTVSGHSVVCYSTETDADGGMQIIVAVNNADKTAATLTTYTFYAAMEDYRKVAASYTDKSVLNDEAHTIKIEETVTDVIGNPDEFVYVAIFGFLRY